MKSINFFFLPIILVINLSCSKMNETDPDFDSNYLIFGHFQGECRGERCVETIKLTGKKLYEDTNDNYIGNDFNFIVLNTEKFEQVKNLKNQLPSQLLTESESILGCPDCYDEGGFFIEYAENGTVKRWLIDKSKSDIPTYLHDFMEKVNDAIDQLK